MNPYTTSIERASSFFADENHRLEATGADLRFIPEPLYVQLASGDWVMAVLMTPAPKIRFDLPSGDATACQECGTLLPAGGCKPCPNCGTMSGGCG